ncbi:gastric inhibitory polypeptide receptor-like, partial [Pyrgilauda ruficollis]|uniref:gastric inhibitory polypeptide receptor-like n=1 Tax=Pyrgilauda ruficollis TaxID=221976 RepID=UPI001B881189
AGRRGGAALRPRRALGDRRQRQDLAGQLAVRGPGTAAAAAGVPVLFVVPWVILRYLYENEGCWERNEKVAVWWLIRCPILAAVAVNFVVFVRIVRILVAKVRAQQVTRGDTRL